MIPFAYINDRGGRIGRIRWCNTTTSIWGEVWWDSWWPYEKPSLNQMAKIAERVGREMALAVKAILPTVQQATESIRALDEAFGRLQ